MSNENGESQSPGQKNSQDMRLNNFLTELVNTQDNKLLSSKDVDELLQKYSLTPEDIEKLTMLIERHLNRALDYKNKERWDSAIVETERALLFAPLNNDVRLDLAELFLKRSVQYGYLQKDLDRAGREVSDALILEPDNKKAKKFQKELKQLKQMLRGSHHNKRFIPLIIIVLMIMAIILYPQIRKGFQFLTFNSSSEQSSSSQDYIPPWETRELIVEKSTTLEKDFIMELTKSTLIRESPSGTAAVSIAGYIESSNGDYSRLDLEIFRADNNSSLGVINVIESGEAPLEGGETESFFDFIYLNDDIEQLESVYIGISDFQRLRDKKPGEWENQILHYEHPMPNAVFLNAESRFVSQIEGYDRNYYFYDLKIINKSTIALSKLDLSVQWRDDLGQVKSEQNLFMTEHEALPIKAQSHWNNRIMFDLQKDVNTGSMTVEIKELVKE